MVLIEGQFPLNVSWIRQSPEQRSWYIWELHNYIAKTSLFRRKIDKSNQFILAWSGHRCRLGKGRIFFVSVVCSIMYVTFLGWKIDCLCNFMMSFCLKSFQKKGISISSRGQVLCLTYLCAWFVFWCSTRKRVWWDMVLEHFRKLLGIWR